MYFFHSATKLVVLIIFWPLTIIIKSYTNYNNYYALNNLKTELREAKSFEAWLLIANKIDNFLGKNEWRKRCTSKKYDYKLIYHRTTSLRDAREKQDISRIISLFNSGLIRDFGGISDKNLFNNSYLGTKFLIHDYINEVLSCLEFINQYNNELYNNSDDLVDLKLRFYHNAKQTFGSTALVLQGGSIFGMYHLGAIKTLYQNNLLPKIISGSYFGSIFACVICLLCSEEYAKSSGGKNILDFFDNFHNELITFGKVQEPELFKKTSEMSIALWLNFYRKSYTPEIYLLLKYVKWKLGDQTFEELYSKSSKILNLVIYTTDKSLPSIVNYITSPNMVVWSALYASIGTDILGDDIQLLVKNLKNEIVPWNNFNEVIDDEELKSFEEEQKHSLPADVADDEQYFELNKNKDKNTNKYIKTRFLGPHEVGNDVESPYERLTELFNVNHFIVSLARLYFKPLVMNDIRHDLHFVKPFNDFDKIIEEAKEKRNERKIIINGSQQSLKGNNSTKGKSGKISGSNNNNNSNSKRESKPAVAKKCKNWRETLYYSSIIETWLLPFTILINLVTNLISNITTLIATPSYTYIKLSKNLQKVINLEIQYRFNILANIRIFRKNRIFQLLKKLTVDEKTPKLSSSEITIVPNVKDFFGSWRSASIVNDITEENLEKSISATIKFGEKSVWALLPILWVRCSIEFALDDLYNRTKEKRKI